MAGNISLKSDGQTTVLNDSAAAAGNNSLTSLAAGSAALTVSPGVDNTTLLDFWMDIEALLVFAVAPTAGKTVDFYLLESQDGTNYADGTAGATPIAVTTHFIGSVPVRGVTTLQRLTLRGIPIPPTKFNLQVVNSADQSLGAQNAGSKINVLVYREQYT